VEYPDIGLAEGDVGLSRLVSPASAQQLEVGTQVELGAVLLDTVSFRFVFHLVSWFRVDRADSFFTFPSVFITICYQTIYTTP
jgi:hypothetical protein